MIGKSEDKEDINLIGKSIALFVDYYNKNIPESFPQATLKALEKFKETYPSLFKNSSEWTIDKHRKKLMIWLDSYRQKF